MGRGQIRGPRQSDGQSKGQSKGRGQIRGREHPRPPRRGAARRGGARRGGTSNPPLSPATRQGRSARAGLFVDGRGGAGDGAAGARGGPPSRCVHQQRPAAVHQPLTAGFRVALPKSGRELRVAHRGPAASACHAPTAPAIYQPAAGSMCKPPGGSMHKFSFSKFIHFNGDLNDRHF